MSASSFAMVLAGHLHAQVFSVLHHFDPNTDGDSTVFGLALSSNVLYGTGPGVFRVNVDGSGFTNLLAFGGSVAPNGVVVSGNTLFGTTYAGPASGGDGSVFRLSTNGTAFTNLYAFSPVPRGPSGVGTNADGANPSSPLLVDQTLYGTAYYGGTNGYGTVFRINTDGSGFSVVYNFVGNNVGGPHSTNGANPAATVVLSGDTLYGTTAYGGQSLGGNGSVFAVKTNGSGYRVLCNFPYDGIPRAKLALSASTLYGTTSLGGTYSYGSVFAINTDGTGFTNLHSFTPLSLSGPYFGDPYTNSDGAGPVAGLLLSGYTLYGTTQQGGTNGNGTVFKINIDGSGFSVLHTFSADPNDPSVALGTNSDGAAPAYGELVLSNNVLYGTTEFGGRFGRGTIFSLSLSPYFVQYSANPEAGPVPLTVQFASTNVDFGGNSITNWSWDFGDGTPGNSSRNPSHAYTNVGVFSPSLVSTNNLGIRVTGVGPSITVSLPTVQFTASPTNGTAPVPVQFSSPGTDSSGRLITHWNWAFGDGVSSSQQNPLHTYTNSGLFSPSLVATNNIGITVLGNGPTVSVSTTLIQNGGFETGTFSSWSLSGDAGDTFVDDGSTIGLAPYSGNFVADLGTVSSFGYLSQALPTTTGARYLLSFWFANPAADPGQFLVSWNGTTLLNQTNPPAGGWTNFQFDVAATGVSSVLQFGFQDNVDVFCLDGVAVTPLSPGVQPRLSLPVYFPNGQFQMTLSATSNQNYTLQMSTDLRSSNWISLFTTNNPAIGTFRLLDPSATNKQRFYRVLVGP